MLILIILLIFIQTMVLPTITVSLHSVEDVARVGQTSFAAKKLASAIQNIQLLPGDASQQILVFVPKCDLGAGEQCTVACNGNTITFFSPLNTDLNEPASCPGKTCSGSISTFGNVSCNAGAGFILTGPVSALVTLGWNKGSGAVNVTYS